jgi:Zn-dependent protease
MRLAGAQITAMRFYPYGVRLDKRGILSYGQEAVVYLGGVAANHLCILAVVPLFGWNLFAMTNAALILFNLLPVGRLDGGQLLRLLLCRTNSLSRAEFLQKCIGFLVLTPLFSHRFFCCRAATIRCF